MQTLYSTLIRLYFFAILIASPFNQKASKWINGRRKQKLQKANSGNRRRIWIHCASLGEFEQGRPIIETIKSLRPDSYIILTFFSPSGYEIRKNYPLADEILYLPPDTPRKAKQFIETIKPDLAIFIKYEFWFNYLKCLIDKEIPFMFVSAIFRSSQHFFKWYGGWFRSFLSKSTRIFVQDQSSLELLEKLGLSNAVKAGDTRFDRVYANSGNARLFPAIDDFKGRSGLVIGGSTWPMDEELMISLINDCRDNVKFIIAPHEVDKPRIQSLLSKIPDQAILYSEIDNHNLADYKVVIIDGIGILSHLYQYADIAIIGGGFGKGIHNILEAATFGVPVIFGPNYQKFREARDLVALKGGFTVSDIKEFSQIATNLLTNLKFRKDCGETSRNYVLQNTGATEIVMNSISNFL